MKKRKGSRTTTIVARIDACVYLGEIVGEAVSREDHGDVIPVRLIRNHKLETALHTREVGDVLPRGFYSEGPIQSRW